MASKQTNKTSPRETLAQIARAESDSSLKGWISKLALALAAPLLLMAIAGHIHLYRASIAMASNHEHTQDQIRRLETQASQHQAAPHHQETGERLARIEEQTKTLVQRTERIMDILEYIRTQQQNRNNGGSSGQ